MRQKIWHQKICLKQNKNLKKNIKFIQKNTRGLDSNAKLSSVEK